MNVGKSKVMRCTRNEGRARMNVLLNREAHEEVYQFKYLGSVIAVNGGVEADVSHRLSEGCKVFSTMNGVIMSTESMFLSAYMKTLFSPLWEE